MTPGSSQHALLLCFMFIYGVGGEAGRGGTDMFIVVLEKQEPPGATGAEFYMRRDLLYGRYGEGRVGKAAGGIQPTM